MKTYKVTVEMKPWPEGGYRAEATTLQGCWVVAATIEQAIQDIREGIEMSLASRIKRGEPLPEDIEAAPGPADLIELRLPVMRPPSHRMRT